MISHLLVPGMECGPCRPVVRDLGLQVFDGLEQERRLRARSEAAPPAVRKPADVAAGGQPYVIRTRQAGDLQPRCAAAESCKLLRVPGGMNSGVGHFKLPAPSTCRVPGTSRPVVAVETQPAVTRTKVPSQTHAQRPSLGSVPGERPYACSVCLKGFISPSHLNMHMRVHTGERPYCCGQCGMRFAQKGNLRAHQRQVHQGKRPFPCPECGKRFTKRGNLRTHQQQVHLGKRPFPCTECGKGYFSQKDLRVHQRIHTGE